MAACAAVAYHLAPQLLSTERPKDTPDPVLVNQGAALAAVGNCVGCHAAPGGAPYVSGRAIPAPFSTLCSSKITPDV